MMRMHHHRLIRDFLQRSQYSRLVHHTFNGTFTIRRVRKSKEGQNAETILKAYYGDIEVKKDYDRGSRICVGTSKSNCQSMDMETYAKRIYEVQVFGVIKVAWRL